MRVTALIIGLLACLSAEARMLRVAVIDTGVDRNIAHLCPRGHLSTVSGDDQPLIDYNGHGTHVAGLIEQHAGNQRYCIISIKFYSSAATSRDNMDAMGLAVQYAVNLKVDLINISAGGATPNEFERAAVIGALNRGIRVVTSAGNERHDLSTSCNYFPACYDKRILVIGNLEAGGRRAPSSNYGNYVKRWEMGSGVPSSSPSGRTVYMSGTSQAAGIASGKVLKGMK
jgi:subtilisin family serine protease